MRWNDHSELRGTHAIFSPSKPGWENYSEETMYDRYFGGYAKEIGTVLHTEAEDRIREGLRINAGEKNSLKLALYRAIDIPNDVVDALDFEPIFQNVKSYVNDCIGFRMDPEIILYNNKMCYGCVDAISFDKNFLRIHDLKTGSTPAHIEQLFKYAALFCLEYKVDPKDIQAELRIYQLNEVSIYNPTPDEIWSFCDCVLLTNKVCNDLNRRRVRNE